MNDLLLARIEERHIHFTANDDISLKGLHEASLLQKSDVIHGAEMGLIIGAVVGLVCGFIFYLYPPSGVMLKMGAILVTTLVGALVGAWASSMIGTSVPSTRLQVFKKDLDEGHILLMVDVPSSKCAMIRELIGKTHPEAVAGGTEPTMPAFP